MKEITKRNGIFGMLLMAGYHQKKILVHKKLKSGYRIGYNFETKKYGKLDFTNIDSDSVLHINEIKLFNEYLYNELVVLLEKYEKKKALKSLLKRLRNLLGTQNENLKELLDDRREKYHKRSLEWQESDYGKAYLKKTILINGLDTEIDNLTKTLYSLKNK